MYSLVDTIIMSSVVRLSRYGKIAALTAAGGSLYLLRDEIKPYLKNTSSSAKPSPKTDTIQENRVKLIDNLPEHIPYLLVGGGTASHSAMRAIRGHDPKAKVLIVGSERHGPYMRPALSKELWYSEPEQRRGLNFKWWNGKERSIFYEIDEFFIPIDKLEERENGGVSLINNIRLIRLDPDSRTAFLENGQKIKYDKCLLAPGGVPKTLPELDKAPKEVKDRIVYFRTADDFLRLEKIAETAKRIVIIGGGFLGSELTCALSNRRTDEKKPKDQRIYQIFPEFGNLEKILPVYLSEFVSEKVRKEGANVIPNVEVRKVFLADDKSIAMKLSDDQILNVDYIVCAVGLEPDIELAKASGLEVDEKTGGYLVNSELEARTNVWVAGDASCFYDIKLGRRRVEHHDHAINSGKQAGQNMVGAGKAYTHQSMFWSDLGTDVSFEAVGIIDSSLRTVSVFADPNDLAASQKTVESEKEKSDHDNEVELAADGERKQKVDSKDSYNDKFSKGLVFYLKDDIIVGVLLWNLFGRLSIARRILNEQKKYEDLNDVAKLFNIYLDD